MATCEKVKIKKREVCIGDLDRIISLKVRSLVGDSNSADFLLNFTNDGDVWAAIQTTANGEVFFDGMNTEVITTHKFYINYISLFTQEIWIEFEGNNYDIINVEDLDERHEFLKLNCVIRGSNSNEASFA
jgi:SPP1 family predicted phage head-tail adaptor